MRLFLTNTLTRRKEPFEPADPARVTMYVCGPTVYNYAHIGNARPAVVFDTLFRVLRHVYGENSVIYARNITDVDDKIIMQAAETGRSIDEITALYAKIYREDMAALGVLAPTVEPHATDHIGEMIAMIQALEARGHAYAGQSGAWFSVASMAQYGKLSGRALEDLQAGARVDPDPDKKDQADFALWKKSKPGEPAWESPWGAGRPGWHIECSAMAAKHLGVTIDIHGGGHDLIFPHHENEIAQSECAHGRPFARYWLHNGFLTMDQEKMSKSIGNVALVHDLLKSWDGEVLRAALLAGHYRAPLDWTDALLQQSKASLDRLYGALARAADVPAAPGAPVPPAFLEALADDLNTPKALAELFAAAGALNKAQTLEEKAEAKGALLAAAGLIGLLSKDPIAWTKGGGADETAEIDALVAERTAARKARNFAEADRIREELARRGVEVMDGAGGSTWRKL